MTGRVLQLDPAAHKVADVLLPWFVNGTLDGDEHAFVERHLEQCVRCQREVEWLRELHLACIAAEADPGASNAARKLRRRLMEPRDRDNAVAVLKRLWGRVRPWSQRDRGDRVRPDRRVGSVAAAAGRQSRALPDAWRARREGEPPPGISSSCSIPRPPKASCVACCATRERASSTVRRSRTHTYSTSPHRGRSRR